jgi:hypothetical protein
VPSCPWREWRGGLSFCPGHSPRVAGRRMVRKPVRPTLTTYGLPARLLCSHIHVRTMAALGLCGKVPDTADPITSIPETKATLLRSIKPMTKTKAPVTRKMGCQRVRANRRMPMTDSRAPVRSHQRSRRGRTSLVVRDLPGGVDKFDGRRFRRCDRSLMAASIHREAGTASLPCVYVIVRSLGTSLYPVLPLGAVLSRRSGPQRSSPGGWRPGLINDVAGMS